MAPNERPVASLTLERLLAESTWLNALACALLGDEQEAEDVAQEARLAALKHAPADPAHARAWLVRVVRNFARRVRRQRLRARRRERLAASPEALPSSEELVAQAQAQRRVVDGVLELTEPQRSTLLLRYFHGLSAREIAARQSLPVETVRTRIKRALAQLRSKLDHDFGARDAWAGLLLPGLLAKAQVGAAGAAGAASVTAGGTGVLVGGVTTMSLISKWVAAALITATAAFVLWQRSEEHTSEL